MPPADCTAMMDGLARGAGPDGQHDQYNDREAIVKTTMFKSATRGAATESGHRKTPTRIALVALAALLTLPAISTDSPIAAKGKLRTVTRTFRGPTVELTTTSNNSPVSASASYPSPISVSGLKGKIRDVNVRLTNLDHARPDDLEMLLVGPQGQTAIVLADVGGTTLITDVTLRLDDEAPALLPDETTLQSGTFRPTNAQGTAIAFNDPAPSADANAALSVFNGANPNGEWRLFVQDDDAPTGIGFFDSWALEITAKAKKRKR